MTDGGTGRDSFYRTIAQSYGKALARLAAAHEADPALSAGAVATRVHRMKAILADRFAQQPSHDRSRSAPSPQNLWKEQKMRSLCLTPDELDRRAHGFEARLRRRNHLDYFAGSLVTLFGFSAGSALFVSAMLHRRGTPQPISGATASRDHYRAELVRHRDALRSVRLWYVAPFLPPFVLIYGSTALRHDSNPIVVGGLFAATLFFMALVVRTNRRAPAALDTGDRSARPTLRR